MDFVKNETPVVSKLIDRLTEKSYIHVAFEETALLEDLSRNLLRNVEQNCTSSDDRSSLEVMGNSLRIQQDTLPLTESVHRERSSR